MNEIIESVKNLSIGFNSQKGKQISILRNVSTNIKKGETVGIVGESGSGKSTLALAMICLLYTSPSPRDQRGSRMPSSG